MTDDNRNKKDKPLCETSEPSSLSRRELLVKLPQWSALAVGVITAASCASDKKSSSSGSTWSNYSDGSYSDWSNYSDYSDWSNYSDYGDHSDSPSWANYGDANFLKNFLNKK